MTKESHPTFNVLAIAPSGKRWWLMGSGLPAEITENRLLAGVYTRDEAKAAAGTFTGVQVNQGWALQLVAAYSDEAGEVLFGKVYAGTVDLTPKWLGVLPAFLAALEGGPVSRGMALQELERMARIADSAQAFKIMQAGGLDIAGMTSEAEVSFHLVTALLADLRFQLEKGGVPYGMTQHHVECAGRWIENVRAARGPGYGSPVYPGPNNPAMYDAHLQADAS